MSDEKVISEVVVKSKKDVPEEAVKVVVRCRPLSTKEIKAGFQKIVKVHPEKGIIELVNLKNSNVGNKQFTFDTVHDENAKQRDIYDETFRPLVESVLMGFNGTIFAYGQTGAGKTFTMEGDLSDSEKRGVIPLAFEQIFNHIEDSQNQEYLVSASYIEIYNEEVRDLLSDNARKCELRQKPGEGAYVKDVTVKVCRSKADLEAVLTVGRKRRIIGATNMNIRSSRSHAIVMLTIEQCEIERSDVMKMGRLNLVDLAGSERQSKTGVVGQRQKESIKINLSLSALGNVISALVDGTSSHIPYRDSKLTRLLQDSLGGNAKTVMVANISPADCNFDETLTTLRYANRAKNIKNSPLVNEDPKDTLLKKYKMEIESLRAELAAKERLRKKKKNVYVVENESCEDEEEVLRKKKETLENEKHKIINDTEMIAEEKEKLLSEIKVREEQLIKENEAKLCLMNRIKTLEGQLLSGTRNIIDQTNEQQKKLEQQRKELADQKSREREIIQKLEEEEETTLEIKETYTNLRQEVDVKTKKLKKLFLKLQALKRELHEYEEINSKERQEKEHIQDMLMRQLKYTHLVIENFVPPEVKAKILKQVRYDEDENLWFSVPVTDDTQPLRPVSADGKSKRPICDFARKMWKITNNPRFKNENIAVIELDFAAESVADYEPPEVDPLHRALMECALNNEKDIEIDASDPKFKSRKSAKRRPRVKTAHRKQKDEEEDEANYPAPRGLVPRN